MSQRRIRITAGPVVADALLDDSATAGLVWDALPLALLDFERVGLEQHFEFAVPDARRGLGIEAFEHSPLPCSGRHVGLNEIVDLGVHDERSVMRYRAAVAAADMFPPFPWGLLRPITVAPADIASSTLVEQPHSGWMRNSAPGCSARRSDWTPCAIAASVSSTGIPRRSEAFFARSARG